MSAGRADDEPFLTPHKALIFRLTHKANVPWILDHGLHCPSSPVYDPGFVSIGQEALIERRTETAVRHEWGGVLSDFVPFYFVPRTPMLLNIQTGRSVRQRDSGELVFLVSTIHRVRQAGCQVLFTDKAAYVEDAMFYDDLARLDQLPWAAWNAFDFRHKMHDPEAFDRYRAEVLVRHHVPVAALLGIGSYDDVTDSAMRTLVRGRGSKLKTVLRREWFER